MNARIQTKRPLRAARQTGLSLIELMVALVVSMVIVGAVFGLMSVSEGRKRTTMSVSDIKQSGVFALYQLDKAIRSAGSGYSQNWPLTYGCRLNVNLSGNQILPSPASIPAPFTGLLTKLGGFRLAPLLIVQNGTTLNAGTSDAIITMAGNAGYGEIPTEFSNTAPTVSGSVVNLSLINTMTFNAGNLVLIADRNNTAGNVQPCYIGQVQAGFTGSVAVQLPLAGAYDASVVGPDGNAASVSATGVAMNLGNVGGGNLPAFGAYGVGANNTLMFFDLLQSGGNGNNAIPLADGVMEMHALYGIDPNNTGNVSWQAPTGAFDAATLSNGSQTAAANLYAIKAVRIGLIMRTSLPERAQQYVVGSSASAPSTATSTGVVSPGPLVLFADVPGLAYTRKLTGAEQNYRYRVLEATIPLRNTLLQR